MSEEDLIGEWEEKLKELSKPKIKYPLKIDPEIDLFMDFYFLEPIIKDPVKKINKRLKEKQINNKKSKKGLF